MQSKKTTLTLDDHRTGRHTLLECKQHEMEVYFATKHRRRPNTQEFERWYSHMMSRYGAYALEQVVPCSVCVPVILAALEAGQDPFKCPEDIKQAIKRMKYIGSWPKKQDS
jgi:hypothetical protein